jgi:hypothetical protein
MCFSNPDTPKISSINVIRRSFFGNASNLSCGGGSLNNFKEHENMFELKFLFAKNKKLSFCSLCSLGKDKRENFSLQKSSCVELEWEVEKGDFLRFSLTENLVNYKNTFHSAFVSRRHSCVSLAFVSVRFRRTNEKFTII